MFIDPTTILVSSRLDDSVLDKLDPERKYMGDGDSTAYDHEDGPKVTFTTPGDVVVGRDEGYIADGDAFETRQGQLLRLAGWIDVESRVTVGCSGAVLAYIHRKRAATFLPGDAAAQAMHRISTIERSFSPNRIPILTIRALQKRTLDRKRDSPSTAYFTTSRVLRKARNLSKIKNMRTVMINLRKGISGTGPGKKGPPNFIWAGIRLFAYHALQIKDSFHDVIGGDRLAIRNKVLEHFHGLQLADVGKSITEIIDFELSLDQGRNVVKHGVDHDLDDLKQTYEGLESLLVQVAQHVAQSVPEGLNLDINVVFFPQIGFLIAIPQDPITGHGIFEGHEDDPWEKMFTTEEFAYYKNENVIEMDSYFGDIYGRICDREIEIIHELAEKILQHEELLTTASDICAEIDCILALVQGAKDHNLVRPRLSDSNILDIRGGRHILQEKVVSNFIPNDTLMAGGEGMPLAEQHEALSGDFPRRHEQNNMFPSMVLVTGPNFSGKSVYLKQVAIIVFMAHVGSFVPASRADIGVTDKIMTRVATRESVSRNQSAFMIDLQQISVALNLATNRSLLIIDEFGKGTDSHDGAGLAAGVFNHLLERGDHCPKVIGATHFHEIFESGFLLPHERLAFGHFEVRVDPQSRQINEQLTYLYIYKQGRSNNSYGTVCAALNGIPLKVTNRAEELVLLAARGEDLVQACAVVLEREREELEDAEDVAKAFFAMRVSDDPKASLRKLLEGKGSYGTSS
ncbi:hypothetical protein E4T43_00033 [Aureobasidium subglaciale]|nr:hypothetical protein E4T43_00033 [Aureobasidium subglaciale]